MPSTVKKKKKKKKSRVRLTIYVDGSEEKLEGKNIHVIKALNSSKVAKKNNHVAQ